MTTNNVCFEFENKMIVSSNVKEVKEWINSITGLTCSETAEANLNCIINNEWHKWGYTNQHISPKNKDGFKLECLRTTGIRQGQIKFSLTDCKTTEEVLAERVAYTKRIEDAKSSVSAIKSSIGEVLFCKLNAKSKSCVDLVYNGGMQFVLRIGQKGYWYNVAGVGQWAYIEEYFTHFDGETLITDEGKNVIDVLNQFINEN